MTWTPSYREATFIFSPDQSYHHSLITEPKTSWEIYKLTADERAKLDAYMTSRASGTQDWITFSDSRIEKITNKERDKGFFWRSLAFLGMQIYTMKVARSKI